MTIATPKRVGPNAANLRRGDYVEWYEELAEIRVPGGSRDHLAIEEILGLLPEQPSWPLRSCGRVEYVNSARVVQNWLSTAPGDGWQDRWLAVGADENLDWIDGLIVPGDTVAPEEQRRRLTRGVTGLILLRIVFPGYRILNGHISRRLLGSYRGLYRPELFAQVEARAAALSASETHCSDALRVITKVAVRTGKDPDQLTATDLLAYRAWNRLRYRAGHCSTPMGLSLGWTVLRGIADLGEYTTLGEATRRGQLTSTEAVDSYQVRSTQVRQILIRYLDERRPHLDYSSWIQVAQLLASMFWRDIEIHHPEQSTLDLPSDIVESWKFRLRTVPTQRGESRCEDHYLDTLVCVRAFYRDMAEWAMEDPWWAQWSVPNPIRKKDTAGKAKSNSRRIAAMHQRIRERLPHLPVLVDTAERHRAEQAALLAATKKTPPPGGETFEHDGRGYRRVRMDRRRSAYYRGGTPPDRIEDLATGEIIEIDRAENWAFWAWATIEVLRHTGVRIEELLEITHLALVAYKVPDSGEVVPMLQIVPSKTNEERLLLVSPELASVLASIIKRLRNLNDGVVPLTARYDDRERVTGPPLPHLFQHRKGWNWKTIAATTVQNLLSETLARTGLTDATGQPLRYTPHDFRRLWATDAVSNGLPVHIAAKILGHKALSTTQIYVAVFDEHLVRSYRSFSDSRRSLRPEAEYREPTEQEWRDFQQHFEVRKLELGTCGRPYASPCRHEHACIRCPSLQVDLRARDRRAEIAANLRDRIDEAKANGWTGEVEGLRVSLNAAGAKLASLDRIRESSTSAATLTPLGAPVFKEGPAT